MAAGNPTRRIGVLLTAAEWSILFEALRRFAMENEAAGRPDRARLTQRVLSKMTIYRLAAGVDAVDDDEEQSGTRACSVATAGPRRQRLATSTPSTRCT
jgi:hypothetical protein